MRASLLPLGLAALVSVVDAQGFNPFGSRGPPTGPPTTPVTTTATPTTEVVAAPATPTTQLDTTTTATTPTTPSVLQDTSTTDSQTSTDTSVTSTADHQSSTIIAAPIPATTSNTGSLTSTWTFHATSNPSLVPSSEDGAHNSGSGHGLTSAEKIGIGVGVGVGLAVIAAFAALFFILARRRRGASQANNINASYRSSAANLFDEKPADAGLAAGGAAAIGGAGVLGHTNSETSSIHSDPHTFSRSSYEYGMEPADATATQQHQQLLQRARSPPPALTLATSAPDPAKEKFLTAPPSAPGAASPSGLRDDWVPTPLDERSGNVSPLSFSPVDSRPPSPL